MDGIAKQLGNGQQTESKQIANEKKSIERGQQTDRKRRAKGQGNDDHPFSILFLSFFYPFAISSFFLSCLNFRLRKQEFFEPIWFLYRLPCPSVVVVRPLRQFLPMNFQKNELPKDKDIHHKCISKLTIKFCKSNKIFTFSYIQLTLSIAFCTFDLNIIFF